METIEIPVFENHLNRIQPRLTGSIEAIVGSMFSGKTSELIRRLRLCILAQKKVQVFKSYRDNRYKEKALVSHDGFELESVAVQNAYEIARFLKPTTQVVGVDEAQFFQNDLVEVSEAIAASGRRVIVAGLDLDYRGIPFEAVSLLMARAESVTKNLAICSRCGGSAHYSQLVHPTLNSAWVLRDDFGQDPSEPQRAYSKEYVSEDSRGAEPKASAKRVTNLVSGVLVQSEEADRIIVGSNDRYEARCRSCFEPPNR